METPSEHVYPAHWEADVVLRDGGTAHIRPITEDDAKRLVDFYEQVSDESKYYRFFAPYPRLSDRDVHRFTHHDYVDRVGLAAVVGGEFIATVRYDRIDATGRPASAPADEAEVAFLVQDAHQGRGLASALLEHIAAVARERGIRRFAAEVLPANTKMIKVFTDAGYTQNRHFEDGVVRLEFDLEPTDRSVAVQRSREQRAEARSVQRLLAPGSVAVIGTGRRPGGMGRAVLRALLHGGFTGRVHAVNRAFPEGLGTLEPEGVPAHRTVGEIGEAVDLAVVAVPAESVPAVVADCGEHGVQGLVVISSGYGESGPEGRERQRELVRQARSYGMRIIGPNAFGILNTAPGVRLNASLAPELPPPGHIGLFTQSGAIGIALLSALHRRGAGHIGTSTFVSAGNRADVSGNDVLQFWHDDPATDVVLMYLESIGNPRKFTRLARRTAAAKPVVVVKGARHSGAAPTGHAVPSARIPDATVSALFRQAGVIRVDTVTELVDTGLLLAGQPLPDGPRVAILGNSESLGLLAYDACLTERLRPLTPLDLTTQATPDDFRTALAGALADDACDAVVVTAIPWVGESDGPSPDEGPELAAALRDAVRAGGAGKPVVVAHLEMDGLAAALGASGEDPAAATGASAAADADTEADGTPRGSGVPAYPAAERAVRALAEAVRYAAWRRTAAEPGRVPAYEDIDEAGAGTEIDDLLAAAGDRDARSFPLPADRAASLLARYGIAVRPALPAPDADTAARAAAVLGYPVALKTTAPHLRHRADLGGVRLDLTTEEALRRAYREFTDFLGKPEELRPVVQAMVPRGVDTVVRAAIDPAAGAVLSFGLSGAPSELLGDIAHRLLPATDRDAAELIRSIRAAPLLFGWRGADPVDTAALEELLLRLSRLVDDHPEVVAVELEPVVVAAHGLSVLGASVRLAAPPTGSDMGPRRLPVY
ncbi:GNAT family N-acetyltransferase [Streptomyces xinghaiensis]|uniref:GNAT family N-acetyltransferase n=2 Tax=Streptomyces TaxID=1883 RepID=A0A3M8F552_9ACTN|nr:MULTISPECIES: bifunctional GNAT family N-acetyltransferase/acetate--CoA ligase family protein [Streptomyces]KNE84357.1 acyl-CoA synthetase [Streptomyces fradiae]OFA58592.1 acyl-CoA synthetase [Streptomyces fradiae]PQM22026.1 GNAT family N-acetyltransferase [Streptomyces xinghaiensis]RKM95277.1 GNAT family N-acetyltransferase [Streptomyces xinghaiensis]RNC72861.1 GNAT family N-acetyltransferase [Streptomyces xinghaiensis]